MVPDIPQMVLGAAASSSGVTAPWVCLMRLANELNERVAACHLRRGAPGVRVQKPPCLTEALTCLRADSSPIGPLPAPAGAAAKLNQSAEAMEAEAVPRSWDDFVFLSFFLLSDHLR